MEVRGQASSDTVSGSAVLPPANAPDLWIGDSSLWVAQVHDWALVAAGSFASTPVVLASNTTTVAATGWTRTAPSWSLALDGRRPLASPRLSTTTSGLLAMQALWQTAGRGATAEHRLAVALLAAGRDTGPAAVADSAGGTDAGGTDAGGTDAGGTDAGEAEVLRAVARSSGRQRFVSTTEQAVLAVNADSRTPNLVAVYPAEGSPVLDFPIVRVAPDLRTPAEQAAADVVVAALKGPVGRAAARRAGFRDASGGDPPSGVTTPTVRPLAAPEAAEQATFLARLASIAAPSRILTVVDVSPSMRAAVPGTGLSRLQLAGRAAAATGDLLADSSSVGLWIFALNLDGALPYAELSPVAPLGERDGKGTHRQALAEQLLSLDRRVTGGGTGLYETALAAVRAARAGYDPRAVNTVVLFTDGRNEFSDTLSLPQVVEALRRDAAAAPTRPVHLVGIGLGPTADLASLRTLVEPTDGAAYRADTPAELQQVLYAALARRS